MPGSRGYTDIPTDRCGEGKDREKETEKEVAKRKTKTKSIPQLYLWGNSEQLQCIPKQEYQFRRHRGLLAGMLNSQSAAVSPQLPAAPRRFQCSSDICPYVLCVRNQIFRIRPRWITTAAGISIQDRNPVSPPWRKCASYPEGKTEPLLPPRTKAYVVPHVLGPRPPSLKLDKEMVSATYLKAACCTTN